MAEGWVTCHYCGGTGKVRYTCREWNLRLLRMIWESRHPCSEEGLGIYRCKVCGQFSLVVGCYGLGRHIASTGRKRAGI
ncbi:MAG: hypothetical protein ACPL5F_01560 [Moorellaceae bacterium]